MLVSHRYNEASSMKIAACKRYGVSRRVEKQCVRKRTISEGRLQSHPTASALAAALSVLGRVHQDCGVLLGVRRGCHKVPVEFWRPQRSTCTRTRLDLS